MSNFNIIESGRTQYDQYPVVDWVRGEEDYDDSFITIANDFVRTSLTERIKASVSEGVVMDDWAMLLNCVHTIKGSGGYCQATKLIMFSSDFQDYLLLFMDKVNPNGATPAEQYSVKETLTNQVKLKCLQMQLVWIDMARELCLEISNKLKQNLQENMFDDQSCTIQVQKTSIILGNQVVSLIKNYEKLVKTNGNDKITKSQSFQDRVSQKNLKSQISMEVDRPRDDKCCNKCSLM